MLPSYISPDQWNDFAPDHYERVSACLFCGEAALSAKFGILRNGTTAKRFADDRFADCLPALFISECTCCGLQQQSPRPTEQALLSVLDASAHCRPLPAHQRQLFEEDFARLEPHVKRGAQLLDVGCNCGHFLGLAAERYAVAGCDPIAAALEEAKAQQGVERLYQGTVKDVPMGAFDAIISLDCFEHLHEPVAFLQEVSKRLASNGLLYVRTIRRESLNARLLGRHWHAYAIWHLIYPTRAQLRQWHERAGFDVVEQAITRKSGSDLRASASHHAKMIAGRLPGSKRMRRYRQAIHAGRRVSRAIYRDEIVLVCRRHGEVAAKST